MKKKSTPNLELQNLMKFISSKYSHEEIDWYISLAPSNSLYNQVEIKIFSNSYAN